MQLRDLVRIALKHRLSDMLEESLVEWDAEIAADAQQKGE
jgi:hypothetical protein